MEINKTEVTELELSLLKVLTDKTSGDGSVFGDEDAWFGFFDKDFKNCAAEYSLKGKTLSGIISSLVKKDLIRVFGDYDYNSGRYNKYGEEIIIKMKGFTIRSSTKEEIKDLNRIPLKVDKKISAKPKKIKGMTVDEFIYFLEKTLIPDLKESGTKYTANEFEIAIEWIKHFKG